MGIVKPKSSIKVLRKKQEIPHFFFFEFLINSNFYSETILLGTHNDPTFFVFMTKVSEMN